MGRDRVPVHASLAQFRFVSGYYTNSEFIAEMVNRTQAELQVNLRSIAAMVPIGLKTRQMNPL